MMWLKIFGPILIIALGVGGAYKCGSDAGIKKDAERSAKIIVQKDQLILDCQGDLAKAGEKVVEQGNTITGLKTAAEDRAKVAAAEIKAAKVEANGFRKRALELAKAKPGPNQCDSARALLVDTLTENRQ